MGHRRRSKKARRRAWSRRRDAALRGLFVAGALLIGVNGGVRWLGGGSPHLLSPFWLPNKLRALGLLAHHAATHLHPWRRCPENIAPALNASAARYGVPVELVRAVARAESAGSAHAISHTGALGVMQLMPGTAAELGVDDPFSPRANIDAGARYLARLWRRYGGNWVRVAAAYNAGPGRVPSSGRLNLPSETRHYVHRVTGRWP